jgi:hypothetical protein
MDLQHYVRKENVDKLSRCTQFIVCYSTQQHNLHWNIYVLYNWSRQYQTDMHQHNLMSISVDPTLSRLKHGSQKYSYTVEDFRDKIYFFLICLK